MAHALTRKDAVRLSRILQELLDRSEATGCVTCDHSGYVLAQQGVSRDDTQLISALGAGVFSASRELARLLGEDTFSSVFHQGERKSIYICAVNTDVLLVVIFSNEGSVGLVKLYAGPAAESMRKVFDDVREREKEILIPEHTFVLNESSDVFAKE